MKSTLRAGCVVPLLLVLSSDCIWPQAALTLSQPSGTEVLPVLRAPVTLPFRLTWGYLIIAEGSIGGLRKLNFLVDTGTSPSIIDRNVARQLGLPEQSTRVNLSNKSVETAITLLPSMALGPIAVQSVPVLSQDLSYFQKALGFKVDAIIGMDLLCKSSFTLNYRTREMVFGEVENLTFSTPFETYAPVVTVGLELQLKHLRVVVDTGGPDLMLFRSRISDSSGFQVLGVEKVSDASGAFERRRVRIPNVYLGKESVGSQAAYFVDDRKDEGDEFDGVLGVRGAQFWKIAFDFEHRRFCWER